MSITSSVHLTAATVFIALVAGSSTSAFAAVCKTTGQKIAPVQRLGAVTPPRAARIVRSRPIATRPVQPRPVAVVAPAPQTQSAGNFEPTNSAPRSGTLSNVFRDLAGGGGDGGGGGGGGDGM